MLHRSPPTRRCPLPHLSLDVVAPFHPCRHSIVVALNSAPSTLISPGSRYTVVQAVGSPPPPLLFSLGGTCWCAYTRFDDSLSVNTAAPSFAGVAISDSYLLVRRFRQQGLRGVAAFVLAAIAPDHFVTGLPRCRQRAAQRWPSRHCSLGRMLSKKDNRLRYISKSLFFMFLSLVKLATNLTLRLLLQLLERSFAYFRKSYKD
ncbi:hypothetical protein AAHA92_00923 [Salvia divinorum]|uniref:Uncharacterized protein n=1 Tax=Salvia divinorum TaxID=28513 RepID=A0ABD1IL70_SALDI